MHPKPLLAALLIILATTASLAKPTPKTKIENLPEQQEIYHPLAEPPIKAESLKLGIQDTYLKSEDGVRINAWWMPPPPGGRVVIYLHGNAGNLTGTATNFAYFKEAGLGALAIDYRGYGLSEGYPSEEGLYRDARAAYAHCLKRGIKPNNIIIHGESLGGAIAANLASQRACAALILESTFTDARSMASYLYGPLASYGIHSKFDTLTKVRALKCPLLVIHGDKDTYIPTAMGQALYNAAPKPKNLWIVPGASHGDVRYIAGKKYPDQLRRFVSEHQKK